MDSRNHVADWLRPSNQEVPPFPVGLSASGTWAGAILTNESALDFPETAEGAIIEHGTKSGNRATAPRGRNEEQDGTNIGRTHGSERCPNNPQGSN